MRCEKMVKDMTDTMQILLNLTVLSIWCITIGRKNFSEGFLIGWMMLLVNNLADYHRHL